MKKTLVTLVAATTLAAVVAPAVALADGAYTTPVETTKKANVEQYGLEVSTKNALYAKAWQADLTAGYNLVSKENAYSAAKLNLEDAQNQLAREELLLTQLKQMYNDDLGLVSTGVVPSVFKDVTEEDKNLLEPLNTVARVDAYYTAAIKTQEGVVASKKLGVAAAQRVLDASEAELNAAKATKAETKAAVDAAKVALDTAIEKATAPAPVSAKTVEVVRLYNGATGNHWFTTDSTEAAALVNIGWTKEGVAFKAPETGNAVYVLTNPNTGYFHFTSNTDEIAGLVKAGWTRGQIVFYAANEGTAVYRVYNPNVGHHFTSNTDEVADLVAKGWSNEGVAYYVAK